MMTASSVIRCTVRAGQAVTAPFGAQEAMILWVGHEKVAVNPMAPFGTVLQRFCRRMSAVNYVTGPGKKIL